MTRSLGVLIALGLAAGCSPNTPDEEMGTLLQDIESVDPCVDTAVDAYLAKAACAAGRLVGTAVAHAPLMNEPEYAEILAKEFTYVTHENDAKWGVLQPNDPKFWDFTKADDIVEAASNAGQAIKGHTLAWHSQLPPFVTDALSGIELLQMGRRHIDKTVRRYRDDIASWDVVNEALLDDGSLRPSIFLEKLGPSYLRDAFFRARQTDADAELFYNDYGIETFNPKSDALYSLVQALLNEKVPIDGVGFQMHVDARFAPSVEELVANFTRFTNLGLSVNISELDVRVAGIAGTPAHRLALQQQIYHRVVYACVQVDGCDAVTTWGFTDKHSWVDSTFGADDPLMWDENYQKKPAYYGMVDGFIGLAPDSEGTVPNLVRSGSFEADAAGWVGFGISGTEVTSAAAHTGKKSGLGTGRTASWQGPAVNLTQLVSPGFEYETSAFVRVAGSSSETLSMSLKTTCAGGDDVIINVASTTATDSSFSELNGGFSVPDCELAEVTLYFEGAAAGVDILVDDVVVRQQAEPLGVSIVANGDFEGGIDGWFAFGPPTLAASSDANTGSGALLTSARTDSWQGPATSLLSDVVLGATYSLSAAVKLEGAASSNVNLTVKSVCDGVDTFTPVASVTANDVGYVVVSGSYQVSSCELSELTLYFEGPAAGVDILIDDVAVQQRLSIPVDEPPAAFNVVGNGGAEHGIVEWQGFGTGIAQTDMFAHSGTYSAVSTGRTATWQGPSYLLPSGEAQYAVSAYVLQDSGAAIDVQLSAKLTCNGSDSFPFLGSASAGSEVWTLLSGSLSVPAGCTVAQVYVQQSGGSVFPDIYMDDVVATPTSVVNLAGNAGVESDLSRWQGFGATLSQTDVLAHSGTYSAVVTGRTASWQGGSYFGPTGMGGYDVSIFVRHGAGIDVTLALSTKLTCEGVDTFPTLSSASIPSDTWIELSGALQVPMGCTVVQPYVQQFGGSVFPDLYLDDVSIVPVLD